MLTIMHIEKDMAEHKVSKVTLKIGTWKNHNEQKWLNIFGKN